MKITTGVWLWPTISILMLLGMVAEARTHITPADAEPHQLRCQKAINDFPMEIVSAHGTWTGKNTPVPVSATQLLRPNTILSRDYVKDGGPAQVSLLIVDCKDARDLQGHYPPNCYPAQGQPLLSQKERTWHLPHMDVDGMEYHFGPQTPTGEEQVVYNFFVTPRVPGAMVSHKILDGVICRDIGSVYESGEDYQRRYFGAAEFQLVSGSEMTTQELDQAFEDLLGPNEAMILTLENRAPGGK